MGLSPGSRLGRYQIVRQLGAGAMGEVYLADDPHIERRLAIKTVRLDLLEQQGEAMGTHLRMRIEREAKAAGRLVHPHVVTLFDAGEADGLFYLAFEYVAGPDLGARVRMQPPLTLSEILRIGREAAGALDAAHRVGIVHRDIKPSNLLLSGDGGVKVADFGIATLLDQGTHLTRSGSFVGTPHYVSPEQAESSRTVDGRSDLFSLGVVLYELLAGRRPFTGDSLAAVLVAIVMKEPMPLGQLRPELPLRLSSAVMRLLEKQPDRRFPSAAALGEELAAIERELVESPATAESEPTAPGDVGPAAKIDPAPPSMRGGLIFVAALFAIVVASGGVLTFQYIRNGSSPDAETTTLLSTGPSTRDDRPLPGDVTSPTPRNAEAGTRTAPPAREDAPAEDRIVGGVVTFRILPTDAANRAVVRIDGLVRGLATGSMMTLRPGRHEIEVVAEGYSPATVLVDSRPDAASVTELEVTLERK